VRFAWGALIVVLVGGCRQLAGLDDPIGGDGTCFGGAGLLEVCFDAPPTDDLDLSGVIDTDNSPLCATNVTSGGNGSCVVAGHSINIASISTVDGNGSRPLVLVATATISVDGTLDGASHRGGQSSSNRGPGADASGCQMSNNPPSGGGGAGGSFGGVGGAGGDANPAGAAIAGDTLRGGCPGTDGGGGEGGRRGSGGGAVYLIAGDEIDVAGTINASGAGGGGGQENQSSGGGGAGSGGMIGADAPTIAIDGAMFANGGGGGEGGPNGSSGNDPVTGDPGIGGNGGSGGDGGDGGGATLDGQAGQTGGSGGGGGGGGGAGVIRLFGSRTGNGVVSPAAS